MNYTLILIDYEKICQVVNLKKVIFIELYKFICSTLITYTKYVRYDKFTIRYSIFLNTTHKKPIYFYDPGKI